MERHFEDKNHASLYKLYRPITHPLIIQRVMAYVKEMHAGPLKLAVDVGCGSGQNTLGFAPYFENVVGTDISQNMVAEATSSPSLPTNVSFLVSPAESLPFPDNSVDMVTAAQCFHWFDHEQFNREMQRVLSPNGVVAVLGHDMEYLIDPLDERKSEELFNVVMEFKSNISHKFSPAVSSFFNRYSSIPFPYEDAVREVNVGYDCLVSLTDFIGVLKTYASYQRLCKEDPRTGSAVVENLKNNLIRVLEVGKGIPLDDVLVIMRLNNFFMLGRKNSIFEFL